jgi:hypothetical protein
MHAAARSKLSATAEERQYHEELVDIKDDFFFSKSYTTWCQRKQ